MSSPENPKKYNKAEEQTEQGSMPSQENQQEDTFEEAVDPLTGKPIPRGDISDLGSDAGEVESVVSFMPSTRSSDLIDEDSILDQNEDGENN